LQGNSSGGGHELQLKSKDDALCAPSFLFKGNFFDSDFCINSIALFRPLKIKAYGLYGTA
jgi:hypothetical protein